MKSRHGQAGGIKGLREAGFGAHPRFEIALERALTELLQGRGLDAQAGFSEPGFDLDEIAAAP